MEREIIKKGTGLRYRMSFTVKTSGAKRHRWTDEEREVVRCEYRGTHASAKQIGETLGVSEFAVKRQTQLMGLATKTDRSAWNPAQDDQLRELLGHYSVSVVAQKMRRSVNSVAVRSSRLGLSRHSRDDWFTKEEVCEILGVNQRWIQKRIDSGILKASYHNGHRPGQRGLAMWHIDAEDLATFIRRYPQDLNGRNVDLIQIVNLLVGIDYREVLSG